MACLGVTVAGPGGADHVEWSELLMDPRRSPSLMEVDACLFGPEGRLDPAEMDAECQAMLETCWSRMHLDPAAGMPGDPETLALLLWCSEQETERYYVLLLNHERDIARAFPLDEGEDRRAEALYRLVRAPVDAATDDAAACAREGGFADRQMTVCAAAWRRDALIRSRQAWWEERQ